MHARGASRGTSRHQLTAASMESLKFKAMMISYFNMMTTQTCDCCGLDRKLSRFPSDVRRSCGVAKVCKRCNRDNDEPWKNFKSMGKSYAICPCNWKICGRQITEASIYRHLRFPRSNYVAPPPLRNIWV